MDGRVFQAEGTALAKALSERSSIWLKCRMEGGYWKRVGLVKNAGARSGRAS